MYFESHAHYDDKQFNKDRQTLLECLPQYGVDVVINSGSDLESSYVGKQLSEQYDYIYFAAGVHPHELYHIIMTLFLNKRRNIGLKSNYHLRNYFTFL